MDVLVIGAGVVGLAGCAPHLPLAAPQVLAVDFE
jgi:hypothetical protein